MKKHVETNNAPVARGIPRRVALRHSHRVSRKKHFSAIRRLKPAGMTYTFASRRANANAIPRLRSNSVIRVGRGMPFQKDACIKVLIIEVCVCVFVGFFYLFLALSSSRFLLSLES